MWAFSSTINLIRKPFWLYWSEGRGYYWFTSCWILDIEDITSWISCEASSLFAILPWISLSSQYVFSIEHTFSDFFLTARWILFSWAISSRRFIASLLISPDLGIFLFFPIDVVFVFLSLIILFIKKSIEVFFIFLFSILILIMTEILWN